MQGLSGESSGLFDRARQPSQAIEKVLTAIGLTFSALVPSLGQAGCSFDLHTGSAQLLNVLATCLLCQSHSHRHSYICVSQGYGFGLSIIRTEHALFYKLQLLFHFWTSMHGNLQRIELVGIAQLRFPGLQKRALLWTR